MKKKYLIVILLSLLFLILGIFILYFFIPWGTEVYYTHVGKYKITVPMFMKIEEENKKVVLSAYRKFDLVKKEAESALTKYKKLECHGRTIYYDEEQDFSISSYELHREKSKTVLTFTYDSSNWCIYMDGVKSDEEHQFDFNYSLSLTEEKDSLKKILPNENSDGDLTVYLSGLENIQVLDGLRYVPLDRAFTSRYKTIEDIISYFEYEVKRNRGSKENIIDGSILYRDKELSLFMCPNKHTYYFGTLDFQYSKVDCK